MWGRGLVEVRNTGGTDILSRLAGRWKSVKVSEHDGGTSDAARVTLVGPPDDVPLPAQDAEFDVLMGWEGGSGLVLQGRYKFQKTRLTGSPEHGEATELEFRSADFVDALKRSGREHYDDTTFGDMVKKLAAKAGLTPEVDPDLAGVKLGYRVRWDQSLIDFATELGGELGATVKPSGGKLIATKRGGGKSATGRDLETIQIRRRQGYGYAIELDPRSDAGSIAAPWQDEKSGERKLTKVSTGRKGPLRILPHPSRTEAEAKIAAEAEAYEGQNRTGSGWFGSPGLPRARAGAPVVASGYGQLVDGSWKAESLEKTVTPKGGFGTIVNVTAGKDAKGGKSK